MARPEMVGKVPERLQRQISRGLWPPGGRLPPARQLAAQLGVSLRTVMAAARRLADRGLLDVRPRRPVTVQPGAAERARRHLRSRPRRQAPRIAILFSDVFMPQKRIPFYDALIRAVRTEAARRKCETDLVVWPDAEQLAVARSLPRTGYDGALFIGFREAYLLGLTMLHEQKFPVMVFNRRIPGLNLPTVVLDNYLAARRIAQHLCKLGHRNLCLVLHPRNHEELEPGYPPLHGISCGWNEYLVESGIVHDCLMPIYLPWQSGVHGLYNPAFRLILRTRRRPTAIVFAHSPWAKAFLSDPEFARFQVPDDLSLATFETTRDLPKVPWCPPLTYLEINYARTAQCMVETLGKMLEGDPDPPVIRVSLDISFTASIGPAPKTVAASRA